MHLCAAWHLLPASMQHATTPSSPHEGESLKTHINEHSATLLGAHLVHWHLSRLSEATSPTVCRLVQWHDVGFGRHLWELPRLAQPLDASAEVKAAVFLTALLQGKVLPGMAGMAPCTQLMQSYCIMPVS